MTATRDFLESTSNELNQAVIRAKEAVTDEKMLRIATRCQQVLEDAWIKHNAAHALYASKLKEPALKAEAQAIWLGEMRSYEAAMDALEEYLENLQVEPGNAQGDTAVDEDEDVDVDVVLINKKLPDMQFNALLKANKKRLLYIMGTVFNNDDLEKTAMEKAAACIVICDKFAPDPDDEDATNIMRVIAVKNFSPKTRCIIQLLHYQNKAYLININGWDWTLHDQESPSSL